MISSIIYYIFFITLKFRLISYTPDIVKGFRVCLGVILKSVFTIFNT